MEVIQRIHSRRTGQAIVQVLRSLGLVPGRPPKLSAAVWSVKYLPGLPVSKHATILCVGGLLCDTAAP